LRLSRINFQNKARVLLVVNAMRFTSLIKITLIATTLIAANGCSRRSPATAEDLRIGRQAMPISEVKLMLHGGSSQNSITDEVKRRHIPEKISAATEIELTESGAKPALIAALKDENNILTENQKDAFDTRMKLTNATRQGVAAMQSSAASAQANAESQERQRLLDLQNETYRIVENKQKEQAARDAKQIRDVDARWKAAERQNGSRRVYSTPSVRRTSGFNQYSITPPSSSR
jgi:hypothetical protein